MSFNLEKNHIQQNIVWGYEKIESLLPQVSHLQNHAQFKFAFRPRDESVVITIDRLSDIICFLIDEIQRRSFLKRVLIFALDARNVAALLMNPRYQEFFQKPFVRIALADPFDPVNSKNYRQIFAPDEWDYEKETWFYNCSPSHLESELVFKHVKNIHRAVLLEISTERGLPQGVSTSDRLLGFENVLNNTRTIFTHPDSRKWNGLLKGRPAVIVGAGPSLNQHLSFLCEIQKSALIIAADTILKPLTDHHIVPHVIASMERDDAVVKLLEDHRDHSQTLLCASAVLRPQAFRVYSGPKVINLGPYKFNEWLGWRRLYFEYGHSCVGYGLTLALTMGCDPIFLLGVDLCWDEKGKGHSEFVPYFQDESYKKQNDALYQRSFFVMSNDHRQVRTHVYWNLFKSEFENFVKRGSSRVYNLSPRGVQLEGIPFLEITNPLIQSVVGSTQNDQVILQQALHYDRKEEALQELEAFPTRVDQVLTTFPEIKSDLKKGLGVLALEKQSYYENLLASLFKREIYQFRAQPQEAAKNLEMYFTQLEPLLLKSKKDAQDLFQEVHQNSLRIY